jgi:hypothetical protein
VEKAEDVVVGEAVAAAEEVEFDGDAEGGDFAAQALDEFDGGLHGAASGEEVVDDDDALAGTDGVLVDLEGVGAVLEIVLDGFSGGGELAGFADGDKAGVEAVGERGAEDKAAGFDAEDDVYVLADVVLREGVDELGEAGAVLEDGGDVVEEDAGAREVRDGADEGLERFAVDLFLLGHRAFVGSCSGS